jgi:protease-4
VETFVLDKASPANKEQYEAILKSIDGVIKGKISASRGFSVADLNKMINTTPYFTSDDAVSSKLVDEIFYPDLLDEKAAKFVKDDTKIVEADDYLKVQHKNFTWKHLGGEKVAVVYATGEIRSGESSSANFFSGAVMGDITVSKMIKDAANDDNVKAIVIRVDSPGGSGLASDNILREIRLAKEKKKSIIVSMGGLAASGGYYISCFADKIYSDETTFTGSIGVFGMMPNLDSLYNRLGITHDRISLNKYAGTGQGLLGLHKQTPDESELMQKYIDKFYDSFIGLVSEGRKMTKEQVDQIAQGRVWTGADAVKIGLVDEIGGLKQAIAEARKRANIHEDHPDAEVLTYYTKTGKFNPMSMLSGAAMSLLPAKLQNSIKVMDVLNSFSENNDNLLLMPVNLEIK